MDELKCAGAYDSQPDCGYGVTAFQRQPSLGSVTSSVFGDFDVSATTFSVVPPKLKFVVKTFGVV